MFRSYSLLVLIAPSAQAEECDAAQDRVQN